MSVGKTVDEPSKVMDVSKPGKGKIMTTSRPVISSIVNAPTTDDIVSPKAHAPSAAHKTIQPLSHDDDDITPSEKIVDLDAEPSDQTVEELAEQGSKKDTEPEDEKEPEPEVEEPAEEEAATETPQEEPEVSEEEPGAAKPESSQPETSDAAGLEAVAGAVKSKKEAIKQAEDAAQKDAALQELIDSKKYVVPIGHDSRKSHRKKHHNGWMIVIIVLLIVAIGAYLAVDAELIDAGFDVPYDLINL